jgi:UDP-N-acetylmuramate-alanine ligase
VEDINTLDDILQNILTENDLIICQGAGNITEVASKLASS